MERLRETMINTSQDSWSLGLELNPEPSKFVARVLLPITVTGSILLMEIGADILFYIKEGCL
jgi:hypothetical protein